MALSTFRAITTDALCNQVAALAEPVVYDAVRSETAMDALRNQVTALAEQVEAGAKGAAEIIPEGLLPSRLCPI